MVLKQPKVGEAKRLSLLQRSAPQHIPREVYHVLVTHGYKVPQQVPRPKLAIVSHSGYVIMEAQGKVQQWQGTACVGLGGGGYEQHAYLGVVAGQN